MSILQHRAHASHAGPQDPGLDYVAERLEDLHGLDDEAWLLEVQREESTVAGTLLNVLIPAFEIAGIDVADRGVSETGLSVHLDGRIVRISFEIEGPTSPPPSGPDRLSCEGLDVFAKACAAYDRLVGIAG